MGLTERKYTPPPRTGIEVFEMLPEGTLAELIYDKIYMSPSPLYSHQQIAGELFTQIMLFVKEKQAGVCIISPIDIFLDDKNVLQPDIVFISKEKMYIIKDNRIKGCPDLIVEILSPGNEHHDKEIKKEVYEKFGVKEYFIVNPKTKETIAYFLENNKYVEQTSSTGVIVSQILNNSFSF
ncbi:MAG: Uma2 family endonuclease [Bacteroidota bacterium]|nr:Uma2 family endonuclease [Bacteroidota bacterium]